MALADYGDEPLSAARAGMLARMEAEGVFDRAPDMTPVTINGVEYVPFVPATWDYAGNVNAGWGPDYNAQFSALYSQLPANMTTDADGNQYIRKDFYDQFQQMAAPYEAAYGHSTTDFNKFFKVAVPLMLAYGGGGVIGAAGATGGAGAGLETGAGGAFDMGGVGAAGSADATAAGLGTGGTTFGLPEATYVGGGGGGGEIPLTMSAESAAADASYVNAADSLAAADMVNTAAYTPTLADAGTAATLAETAANQTGGAGGGGGGGEVTGNVDIFGNPITPGSVLGAIPNNVLAGGLQAGLGYLGAEEQADAYAQVAAQNLALGAPYRATLEQSYQPGFDLWSQPGYAGAFDQSANAAARAVSAKSGNPFGNPGAMGEISNAVMSGAYLPTLANYRGQLGQFGGLGLNTAGAAQLGGAQNAGAGLGAIGYGLGTALNPQPTLADLIKAYGGGSGKLTYGY